MFFDDTEKENKKDIKYFYKRIDELTEEMGNKERHLRKEIDKVQHELCNLKLSIYKNIYDYLKEKGKHFVVSEEMLNNNYYEKVLINKLLEKTFGKYSLGGAWGISLLFGEEVKSKQTINDYGKTCCLSQIIEDIEQDVKTREKAE